MEHHAAHKPAGLTANLLEQRVREVLAEAKCTPAQWKAINQHVGELVEAATQRGIQTGINDADVLATRVFEGLQTKIPDFNWQNAVNEAAISESRTALDADLHATQANAGRMARQESLFARATRSEVLLNGGVAALSIYGALHSLMQARSVDEQGKAHYHVTPIMLGSVQAMLAGLLITQAVHGLRR
ncbi:MAG: hypothetical protein K2Q12_03185 [Rickettsiales bacterium]|nr:hypothetical protein [Rickettsiales bacterium]